MSNMLEHRGYLGSVLYSDEDQTFHGRLEFMRDLVTYEGSDARSLKSAFQEAVDDYLRLCEEHGRTPDVPLKGSYKVRSGRSLHLHGNPATSTWSSPMIEATDANLASEEATAPLTAWLISAAKAGTKVTYGIAADRLMQECRFRKIFSTRMGFVAGTAMDNILEKEPPAPLLNVLLVRQDTRLPGDGAAGYLVGRYPKETWLKKVSPSKRYPERWEKVVRRAAGEVYAYTHWESLYERIYKRRLPKSAPVRSVEKDGLRYGRKGEGENHKALRLWVKNNPQKINHQFHGVRTETEYQLLSGDRVDVVYFSKNGIVALEVKSKDSNSEDIRRGIYQCVKYRAVLCAMPVGHGFPIESWLVTQTDIDKDLKDEARKLNVEWLRVPP